MDSKAVIVLPKWPDYMTITKELKLLKQIPIEEEKLIRPTITGGYYPHNFIKSIWIINYRVIDADTPIIAPSPTIVSTTTTFINAIPIDNSIENTKSEATIEAVYRYLSATIALVVMNPLENHSRMRFTQEILTSKANTLIDTATSLNFMSKKLLNANEFYKYCKAAPKIVVKAANKRAANLNRKNILSHGFRYCRA